MSNIESDINQNLDKIITKIDIQDFLQILEKYALKLENFSVIKDLLNKEKVSMATFPNAAGSAVADLKTALRAVFAMKTQETAYLTLAQNAHDPEDSSSSVLVSFENKEIFETAILKDKLAHTHGDDELDRIEHGNFKVKRQQNSEEFTCHEEKLEFSLHEAEEDLGEENAYEHPMIGERRVLGQDLSKNTKCLTVSKCNRLENTLKKPQAMQIDQEDMADTVKAPISEAKIMAFQSRGLKRKIGSSSFSIDNASPLSKLSGTNSMLRMNKYKDILKKVEQSNKKKEIFYSGLLNDNQPFVSPQPQTKFFAVDHSVILEDKVGEDYQSPIFKELRNQEELRKAQAGNKNQQSENCKNFFQIIE